MINWKNYGLWILITEAIGGLSGWLTREGSRAFSETVTQPPLSPPAIVFPIVWGILYALMGISAARVWMAEPTNARQKGLNLYWIQLILNFFWSLVFFNAQAWGLALVWVTALWAVVLWMILTLRKVDSAAAYLQIPYLLWLTFAIYLTAGVWYLN